MNAGRLDEQLVVVDGRQVSVRISGRGGPVVVMVSCAGGDHSRWEQLRERLDATTTCVSYCRPGTGPSEALGVDPGRRTTVADAVAHLRRVLDAAEVPPPYVLTGSSIGAWIVDGFLGRWPDEVAGVVQIDPTMLTSIPGLNDDDDVDDSDDDTRRGFVFDWPSTLAELHATPPGRLTRRAIVVSRAPGSISAESVASYWKPLTVAQVDQGWSTCQLEWVQRLAAIHVVADTAGHHVQSDQPDLVAHLLRQVVAAARTDHDDVLDVAELATAGGVRR